MTHRLRQPQGLKQPWFQTTPQGGWRGAWPPQGNPAATTFSPSDVAGLVGRYDATTLSTLWQDSARTTPVAADGDRVGAWDDRSVTAAHLLQATAGARGTYKTGIQNSLPVVRFDGTDDLLQVLAVVFGAQPITIIGAIKTANTDVTIQWDSGVDATRCGMYHGASVGGAQEVYSGTAFIGAAHTAGAFHVYETFHSGALSAVYVDGTQLATGDAGANGLTGFTVGANPAGNGPSAMDAGEILIYAAGLTAGQRTSLNAYLKAKWATP